ncbi:MAG: DNA-methyltransferase [Caldisphaera sp.]
MFMAENFIDTITCIDALEGLKKIKNNSIDLILTDPPYGISREINIKGKRIGSTAVLDFNFGEWDKFEKKWIDIALKKTKGWFISFCAKKDIGVYWDLLEKNKFIAIDALVWHKPDPLPFNAKSRFVNAWEAIISGKKPGAYWGSKYQPNVLTYQAPKNNERVHPTQKPLKLIEKLIELTTKPGDVVLDPFIGSGTTAVACKMLGRHYIGFEINRDYCKIAKDRIKNTNESLFTFLE